MYALNILKLVSYTPVKLKFKQRINIYLSRRISDSLLSGRLKLDTQPSVSLKVNLLWLPLAGESHFSILPFTGNCFIFIEWLWIFRLCAKHFCISIWSCLDIHTSHAPHVSSHRQTFLVIFETVYFSPWVCELNSVSHSITLPTHEISKWIVRIGCDPPTVFLLVCWRKCSFSIDE